MLPNARDTRWTATGSTGNRSATPGRLGDSYENHVLVAQTGNANTTYIDHTAEPGTAYEYGVAAYRSRFSDRLSPISHPAYARSWE